MTDAGLRVHVGPEHVTSLENAVRDGGGVPSALHDAEAIVYFGDDHPDILKSMLHPGIRWVHLPHAGIEPWLAAGLVTGSPAVSCCRGVYGEAVAEHALALMLAAARSLHTNARSTQWAAAKNSRLFSGSTIALIGAGGIGTSLIRQLEPFDVTVNAVSRRTVVGAARTVTHADFREVLPDADYVVLAAPATPDTRHLLSGPEFDLMKQDAWVINVARGQLIDTEALQLALQEGRIGGAALDVTDPEPLPVGHPLWNEPNVLITPHTANPESNYWNELNQRVRDNVRSYIANDGPRDLAGLVRPSLGY